MDTIKQAGKFFIKATLTVAVVAWAAKTFPAMKRFIPIQTAS